MLYKSNFSPEVSNSLEDHSTGMLRDTTYPFLAADFPVSLSHPSPTICLYKSHLQNAIML